MDSPKLSHYSSSTNLVRTTPVFAARLIPLLQALASNKLAQINSRAGILVTWISVTPQVSRTSTVVFYSSHFVSQLYTAPSGPISGGNTETTTGGGSTSGGSTATTTRSSISGTTTGTVTAPASSTSTASQGSGAGKVYLASSGLTVAAIVALTYELF
jgi:hypothetical protein